MEKEYVKVFKYSEKEYGVYVYSVRKDFKQKIVPIARLLRETHGKNIYKYDFGQKVYYTSNLLIIIKHIKSLYQEGFTRFMIDSSFLKETGYQDEYSLLLN